jgi:Domain of unknown function (DUF4145)
MANENWVCPFCGATTVIRDHDFTKIEHVFQPESGPTYHCIVARARYCRNEKCRRFTLDVDLTKGEIPRNLSRYVPQETIGHWQLIPESEAKEFPAYVPSPLLTDYKEACRIKTLSPKASATLSRRCLQGMIRDFWKISKKRLVDEINELKAHVDSVTWEAIDGVRSVGNIGAHMEQDINVIVDVDPDEAGLLIGLIETLIETWYVERHEKNQRLQAVIDLAKKKKPLAGAPSAATPQP